jgi:hypothetical protein
MDPMDDALMDRLTVQAQRKSRKGRKAKWRLEQMLKKRIRLAENAVLNPLGPIAKFAKRMWKAFELGDELKFYAKNDAVETFRPYQHYVHSQRPTRAR